MFTLENDNLKVTISAKGAELQSIYNKHTKLEYLWSGDPKFWAKKSPVLFPIVGELKDGKYIFNNKEYKLPRHGFARDKTFEAEQKDSTCAVFTLKSDEKTFAVYPFEFIFHIEYNLKEKELSCTYTVQNINDHVMFFSVGGHPAFNVPLVKGLNFEDYYFHFNEVENSNRWTLKNNLIDEQVYYFKNQNKLQLKPSLFYDDALVFKDLKSTRISICSDKSTHGLHCDFAGFPYMGLWAAKDAPFVCIEPWHGIADSVNHNQELENKEGIIKLEKGNIWRAKWSISCF